MKYKTVGLQVVVFHWSNSGCLVRLILLLLNFVWLVKLVTWLKVMFVMFFSLFPAILSFKINCAQKKVNVSYI